MLDFMERNTIRVLFKKGHTRTEIAELVDCSRKTVSRVLDRPSDAAYHRSPMASSVDPYNSLILDWLKQRVPVKRMLELVQDLEDMPYKGGKTVFYERVKLLRQQHKQQQLDALVTFESLPGEFLQVDWGETKIALGQDGKPEKWYFLCCRLKYSRFMFVEFHKDMKLETLIRSLCRCFQQLGGVPWLCGE